MHRLTAVFAAVLIAISIAPSARAAALPDLAADLVATGRFESAVCPEDVAARFDAAKLDAVCLGGAYDLPALKRRLRSADRKIEPRLEDPGARAARGWRGRDRDRTRYYRYGDTPVAVAWLDAQAVAAVVAPSAAGRSEEPVEMRDLMTAIALADPTLDLGRARIAGSEGVTEPEAIAGSKVNPVYPVEARRDRSQGAVVLQALVRPDGRVGDVRVFECTREGVGFEEAAVEAVRQWRFEPARFEGDPVAVYHAVLLEFTLR